MTLPVLLLTDNPIVRASYRSLLADVYDVDAVAGVQELQARLDKAPACLAIIADLRHGDEEIRVLSLLQARHGCSLVVVTDQQSLVHDPRLAGQPHVHVLHRDGYRPADLLHILRTAGQVEPQRGLGVLSPEEVAFLVRPARSAPAEKTEAPRWSGEAVPLLDELTGLPNRSFFDLELSQTLAQAERTETLLALLHVQLSAPGGQVLSDPEALSVRTAAHMLRVRLRRSDSLARLAEGTFGIVLWNLAQTADAALVAKDLLTGLADALCAAAQGEARVEAAIGASVFPTDGQSAGELLQRASHPLYAVTINGRHCLWFPREDT